MENLNLTSDARARELMDENTKLREDLNTEILAHKRTRSLLKEMLDITSTILESGNFNTVARKIFDAGSRVLGATAGYVALLSDDGMENELLFLEDGGLECTVDHDLPMPVRGLRAESYRTGKVVYDNHFMQSEWTAFLPKGHLDLPNVLFAPLNIDGKTVGIMGFSNKEGDFTEEDAIMAGTFGEYAAIALRNSRFISEIEAHSEELDEMNATKDKFFSIIAHDLKSPFISIIGLSGLLLEEHHENNYTNLEKFLSIIHDSADQTYQLLGNLLDWSRIQTGRIQLDPHKMVMLELVKEAIAPYRSTMEEKQLEFLTPLDPELRVCVDEQMFKTIFRNLISNAIKFTPENGRISISAVSNDEGTEIRVKDSGVGIRQEDLKRLFQVDQKFSTPGLKNEKGSGLGLILCKEFVEQHQGTITAYSEPGMGTEMVILIPHPGEE